MSGTRERTLTGLALSLLSWIALLVFLWESSRHSLYWIAGIYLAVVAAELLFSRRRMIY